MNDLPLPQMTDRMRFFGLIPPEQPEWPPAAAERIQKARLQISQPGERNGYMFQCRKF